ncbi:protein AMN1 homolog [Cottoperca gobio]|uniref:Protein AMN1 homolog n=1 Tax=Cottoperca gobio TaxID=56716 RepID=A0A6J2PWA3_COTGO|nr:uncharacterized protein LOC115009612 [Cottoperca gobio]
MQPSAWMNGQYRQVGPSSQSSQAAAQLTHDAMRNQQTRTTNNSCQYMTVSTGIQPPQSANFICLDGAYSNRQPSNWQTSAVPHQVVSCQQPVPGKPSYLTLLLSGKLKHSSNNTQRGNPGLPVTYGFQQDFQQNSVQSPSTQSPPNMKAQTTYLQQDMSALVNQSVRVHRKPSISTQDGNVVADLQHCRHQNSSFHNFNGELTKPVSGYTATTATSPPNEEVVYTAASHNRQTARNHKHRPNGTQHGFSPSTSPPSYNATISFRNDSITTSSSSSLHNSHVSTTSQKTLHYLGHNNRGEATSSINSNSYNAAVDTQQDRHRLDHIARIEDYLRNSFVAGPDVRPVHTSSPYGGKQFASEVRMTESNQNMQAVASNVTERHNSGQSLPQTTHSVMLRQHSVDVPLQQSSVPNRFYATAKQDGSENGSKAANAFFPKLIVRSLSDSSQLRQMPEGISSQRNETQSSVANNRERVQILETLSSVKANDGSIHSFPGQIRAVAVVQPLLQEIYPVARKQSSSNSISQSSEVTATDESLSNPEKLFISPKNKPVEYWRHSAASNHGTFVSSSESAGKKHFRADETGSEVAINMQVDQRVAQQSVTTNVSVRQNNDKNEMPTDPKGFFELSSVPTTTWTPVTLIELIQDTEKAQVQLKEFSKLESVIQLLLRTFWSGHSEEFRCKVKTGWYKDLITGVNNFCIKHVAQHTVVLSQVKPCFRNQLKIYHVLKDDEVYSELPYKSSWLNVNEQLDDIDKEFDFPQSLKHDNRPARVMTDNGIPSQIVSEVSNKKLSSTEHSPVDSSEEKQDSTVEANSKQTASPNKTESADSSDPCYSFKIQVLTPEEAKVIYEQVQIKLPKSMDMDNQPERVTNSSVEGDLPTVRDATFSDTKLENKSVGLVDQVCCLSRWVEIICGSNAAKCECKSTQSHEDITDKTLDKEEMAEQKKDELCAIKSDSKLHSATDGKKQAEGDKNVDHPVMTLCWPELCNGHSLTIDQTEDDKLHSYADKETTNNISQIILLSKNGDCLSSSENEIPNQMPDFEKDLERAEVKLTESNQSSRSDEIETKKFSISETDIQSDPEVDCIQNQLKSTGNVQSCTLDSSGEGIENLSSSKSEVESQMSDLEENCRRAQLTSTNGAESSMETEGQTQIVTGALQTTWTGKHDTVKRKKRRSSHNNFFPAFKKSKKCKSIVDVEDDLNCGKVFLGSEPSASNTRTVELVLFGSTPQNKCLLIGSRKSHISSPEAVYDAVPRPPNVITVKLSPLKRKSSETVSTRKHSVKRSLCEKSRTRFSLTKIRHRRRLKTQAYTFESLSLGCQRLPASSEMRICSGKTKHCQSLKRSRSHGLKRGEQNTEKRTVTLNQPADQERSKAGNGSHAVMPLQNNDVLKFNVLPNTFNFKDGSNGRKETNDPVPDNPGFVEGNDKSHNKTVQKAKGTWCKNPQKKCIFSPPTPTTDILFHEFQKKYKEKNQPSVDE